MIISDILVVVFVLWWEWWRKRGKIKVRVKTPLGEKTYWKKPEEDGKTIVMKKAKGRKPGWKFTFSKESLFWVSKWLGRKCFGLDVIYDAPNAVDWKLETKETNQPVWDKKTSKKWIEAEVLEKRARGLKYGMPGLFWLVLIIQVVTVVVCILTFQKLGGF